MEFDVVSRMLSSMHLRFSHGTPGCGVGLYISLLLGVILGHDSHQFAEISPASTTSTGEPIVLGVSEWMTVQSLASKVCFCLPVNVWRANFFG
jgi:hypothetical protein